ncbi:MAG: hypothetical protein ACR2P8_04805 [Myxococcota bacterium]
MIEARWTLRDVFGPGHVYDPAPCFEAPGWLPQDRSALDFLTGAQLVLARDLPVVCHRAVSTPGILELLEEAGLSRPRRLLRYHDADSYRALLDGLAGQDVRLALQHSHPPDAFPPERLWIPRSVLCFVNNKRNLLEFVPETQAPPRRVVSGARFRALSASQLQPPVVVKAAEDLSSGAGYGVRVCRTLQEVEQAQRTFAACEAVVVEDFLRFELTWCVQFIIAPDGGIHDAGAAEQVCGPSGAYRGNWLAATPSIPREALALGREIVDRVAAGGYRGFLGIDIGLGEDGRVLAFDLNGRFTGSAVALSLFPSLAASDYGFARWRTWLASGDFPSLERSVRDASKRGILLPVAAYDPRCGDPSAAPRVSGLLLGRTRDEVLQREKALAEAGLG